MATTSAVNFPSASLSRNDNIVVENVTNYLANESSKQFDRMGRSCEYENAISAIAANTTTTNHRRKRNHSPDDDDDKTTTPTAHQQQMTKHTSATQAESESTKKRRKQSTPIKISATQSPNSQFNFDTSIVESGKSSSECTSPDYANEPGGVSKCVNDSSSDIKCETFVDEHALPNAQTTNNWTSNNLLDDIISTQRSSYHHHQSSATNHLSPLPLISLDPHASGQFPARTSQSSRLRIFNPDAYCELCNKEFCNKYFLKTHKANKHGIYTDLSDATCAAATTGKVNAAKIWPNIDTKDPTLTYLKVRSHEELRKQTTDTADKHEKADIGEHAMVTSENNNTNNHSDKTESPLSQRESPNMMNYHDTYGKTDDNDVVSWPFMHMLHSPSLMQAIPRPHGLGIVNPDAYCDICCKEYCNKYFLRTHKLKRHATLITDDGVKESSTNIQTSPLNLILSEQQQTIGDEHDQYDDMEEIACNLCGMYVGKKYLKSHAESCQNDKSNGKFIDEHMMQKQLTRRIKAIASATDADDESIGEDLRKLQSMILQLNTLNICQTLSCEICNKDFDNKIYLQAHVLNEHGSMYVKLIDEKLLYQSVSLNADLKTSANDDVNLSAIPTSVNDPISGYLDVINAGGTSQSQDAMRADDNGKLESAHAKAAIVSQRTSSTIAAITPTNSYCEICNKELCNKYFMKTHMQRMHGIEIENGAQIGGVVCNVCNKELCSKYFLRVHKQNTHGIVEDGVPLPQTRQSNDDSNQSNLPNIICTPAATPNPSADPVTSMNPFTERTVASKLYLNDSSLRPNELGDLNHRYFAHFTEVCTICSRRFRSTKWLKAHLLADHGKIEHDKFVEMENLQQKKSNSSNKSNSYDDKFDAGDSQIVDVDVDSRPDMSATQDLLSNILGADKLRPKNYYYCSFCDFSTPVLAFLFVHERSHTPRGYAETNVNAVKCDKCDVTFVSEDLCQRHMRDEHDHVTSDDAIDDCKTRLDQTPDPATSARDNTKDIEQQSGSGCASGSDNVSGTIDKTTAVFDQCVTETEQNGVIMQPFLIEEMADDAEHLEHCTGTNTVVPTVVLLPVRERITKPLVKLIKFTPTEQVPK